MKQRKMIVLDKSVILQEPRSPFLFGDNDVIIPAAVIEELDKIKSEPTSNGRSASIFGEHYRQLREQYKKQMEQHDFHFFPLDNEGTLSIELNHRDSSKLNKYFDCDEPDNRVLNVAINLATENPQQKVLLVTNNSFMNCKVDSIRHKLNLLNLSGELYNNDRLINSIKDVHTGVHEFKVSSAVIDRFMSEKQIPLSLITKEQEMIFSNDFLLLTAVYNESQSVIGRVYIREGNKIVEPLHHIKEGEFVYGLLPKNARQRMYFDLLLDPNIPLVTCIGKAGTGKTLLALAAGLHQTEKDLYKKVFVARPIIPVGKDIGYLPGEKEDKLKPWMQPFYDNLEYLLDMDPDANKKNKRKRDIAVKIEQLPIQIEVLTYIRGRSIPNQYIIIDEAQNLTKHEVKTIITRLGKGSKIVLMGDPEQIDHPYLDPVNNGLVYAIEKLKQEKVSGVLHLEKGERSSLAELAAKLL